MLPPLRYSRKIVQDRKTISHSKIIEKMDDRLLKPDDALNPAVQIVDGLQEIPR